MKILKEYPPNFSRIVEVLHPANNYMYTYGDAIYAPHIEANELEARPDILAHEEVHMRQQKNNDEGWLKRMNPQKWWDRYLVDGNFRMRQELEAYQEQWRFVQATVRDRNMTFRMLRQMATDLSSANYGSLISFESALEKIRDGVK